MRRFVVILILVAVGLGFWAVLLLRPWVPPGTSVFLMKTNSGLNEMQIWQRKTPYVLEPFETELFVKHKDQPWALYIIDHQDIYKPSLKFTRTDSEITILSGNKVAAYLDPINGHFYNRLKEGAFTPMGVEGEPPGKR
jgi:hypothetical protein